MKSTSTTAVSWKKQSGSVSKFLLSNAIYFVLAAIFLVMVMINPGLLTLDNISFILSQASTRVIFALGIAGIIILGHTDLSLGRMIGLSGILVSSLLQNLDYPRRIFSSMPRLPLWLPILGAMLLSALIMILLGLVIAKIKVPSFIASLAFQLIVMGILSLYFDYVNDSSPIGGLDDGFKAFVQGGFMIGSVRLPFLVIYAAIVTAIIWFIWNKTKLGKNMYAIGGNPEAANVSGVKITKNLLLIFLIAGLLYGLGGSFEAARTGSASNSLGYGYELDAIAACVVGGVSMRGGVGTIPGVLAGVLIFQLVSYGLVFLGVNPYIQYLVKGLIILLAISIDTQKYVKRR